MLSASISYSGATPFFLARYGEHELPRLELRSRDSDYVLEFRAITFEDASAANRRKEILVILGFV
jgi:hypothetical protein